jgi:hypothetical protein
MAQHSLRNWRTADVSQANHEYAHRRKGNKDEEADLTASRAAR